MKNSIWFSILAAALCMVSSAVRADLNDGLEAYYPLDGNAYDMTGNLYDGVEVGTIEYVEGLHGLAAHFVWPDVANHNYNYIELPRPVIGDFGGDWTIAAWVYLFPTEAGGGQWHNHTVYGEIQLGWSSTNLVSLVSHRSFGYRWVPAFHQYPNPAPPDDYTRPYQLNPADMPYEPERWYHVAVQREQDRILFYINGEKVGEEGYVGPTSHALSGIYIGFRDIWPSAGCCKQDWFFHGYMDELRIYHRALTDSEIERLSSPAPTYACTGFEPPLANHPVTVRGKNRALPFKAELFDQDLEITGVDLVAPPVIQVLYDSGAGEESVEVDALPAGQGSEGNQFVYTDDGKWQFNLKTTDFAAAGTYSVMMVSGDDSEYAIDPTCESSFIRK